jgi:hypothetical protein
MPPMVPMPLVTAVVEPPRHREGGLHGKDRTEIVRLVCPCESETQAQSVVSSVSSHTLASNPSLPFAVGPRIASGKTKRGEREATCVPTNCHKPPASPLSLE